MSMVFDGKDGRNHGTFANMIKTEVETLRVKLATCKELLGEMENGWYDQSPISAVMATLQFQAAKEACK